jgi:ribosome biogenesis protein ENP2
MKVTATNNVQVYTVSGEVARSLPEWLVRQKKKTLRNDPGSLPVPGPRVLM